LLKDDREEDGRLRKDNPTLIVSLSLGKRAFDNVFKRKMHEKNKEELWVCLIRRDLTGKSKVSRGAASSRALPP
jgi:hypothetical protein